MGRVRVREIYISVALKYGKLKEKTSASCEDFQLGHWRMYVGGNLPGARLPGFESWVLLSNCVTMAGSLTAL